MSRRNERSSPTLLHTASKRSRSMTEKSSRSVGRPSASCDLAMPRVAGHLIVANGRVFIESSATIGRRALEVRTDGGINQIPIGEGHSPREGRFDIFVRGTNTWKVSVATRSKTAVRTKAGVADLPTSHFTLDLSDVQRGVLEEYYKPVRRGRVEPATHKEVAASLNRHQNTVRETLYAIWTLMFELDIPMPDISDKRIAVVEAARVHGLLSSEP